MQLIHLCSWVHICNLHLPVYYLNCFETIKQINYGLAFLFWLGSFWRVHVHCITLSETYRQSRFSSPAKRLLLINSFLNCIVVQSNIDIYTVIVDQNAFYSKWIIQYTLHEKNHTHLYKQWKCKTLILRRRKLYVHVFVAALQMDEVLPKYKSHPHSHIYFLKNDNLR